MKSTIIKACVLIITGLLVGCAAKQAAAPPAAPKPDPLAIAAFLVANLTSAPSYVYLRGTHMIYPMLFIPGPTPVAEDTLAAMIQPQVGHRTPEFSELWAEVTAGQG